MEIVIKFRSNSTANTINISSITSNTVESKFITSLTDSTVSYSKVFCV